MNFKNKKWIIFSNENTFQWDKLYSDTYAIVPLLLLTNKLCLIEYVNSRIFIFLNVLLICSTIWNNKLICSGVIWLSIYGIFLVCLAINARHSLKIWVPGISQNPYLKWLIPDEFLLTATLTVACWLTLVISLSGLSWSKRALLGENLRNEPVVHQGILETTSLLPPSYSDCESPPPCYSQAVKLISEQSHQPNLNPKCPTYEEAIRKP